MIINRLILFYVSKILNVFLYNAYSSAFKAVHHRLNGKSLKISIEKFQYPLILLFKENQLNILNVFEEKTDCSVTINFDFLKNIKNIGTSKNLIIKNNLNIQGDIQIIKDFINLIDIAEFDLAELISPYIGDILTEGIHKVYCITISLLYKKLRNQKKYFKEWLTEEWYIVPSMLEVEWFINEINDIKNATTLLSKDLSILEKK